MLVEVAKVMKGRGDLGGVRGGEEVVEMVVSELPFRPKV